MGKSRTIQVEVRKKARVLASATRRRRGRGGEAVLDADEIALREAEAKQHAELAARQERKDVETKRRKEGCRSRDHRGKGSEEANRQKSGAAARSSMALSTSCGEAEEKAEKARRKAKKQKVKDRRLEGRDGEARAASRRAR